MLSILLINENKIVSRLFQLSSQKHNYELEEVIDYDAKEGSYNAVFIDSKVYEQTKLDEFKSKVTFDKLTYLGDKGETKPDGFDLMLEKPFLPTDFVNLMSENFKVVDPNQEIQMSDSSSELDELDLDSLDDLDLEDELPLDNLDELDLDNDLKDIDLDLAKDAPKEELADMVAELDDIDGLKEDSIVSQDLVKETIDEVTESIDDKATSTMATAAAAVTAAATAATLSTDDEPKDTLNILDGVETIESEDDYLVDSKPQVDKLADEFDSLNEEEMQKVMSGESVDLKEVSTTEFIQEDDKVVESDDLENLITRAVSKALTKDMIHEALKDMDIVISLKPKES